MPDGRAIERRAHGSFGAVWVTLAIFLVLVAVLAVRVSAGEDPALLALKAKAPRSARQVLVKRIYERVVVVHLPPNAPRHVSSSSQQVSSEGIAVSLGAPVTRTS